MNEALLIPLAVGTGVVVIVVAIAVVLVVLFVTLSIRQSRNARLRRDLVEAHERAAREPRVERWRTDDPPGACAR